MVSDAMLDAGAKAMSLALCAGAGKQMGLHGQPTAWSATDEEVSVIDMREVAAAVYAAMEAASETDQ